MSRPRNPEYYASPIEIPAKTRDDGHVIWEVHYSGNVRDGFLAIPGYQQRVEETVPGLYLDVYSYRNEAMARARVTMSLSHPYTFLLMARDRETREYLGYGVFPRLEVGEKSVIYSSRAFTAPNEGRNLGTDALDVAIALHNYDVATPDQDQEPLSHGALYTGNPASVASIVRSENTANVRPLRARVGLPKGGGRYELLSDPLQVVKEVHTRFMPNTIVLKNTTGVCKGELWGIGPNRSYQPGRSSLVDEIYAEMVSSEDNSGLDMNLDQGDVVVVVYDIVPSESNRMLLMDRMGNTEGKVLSFRVLDPSERITARKAA